MNTNKIIFFFLIILLFCPKVMAGELPNDLKKFLKKKYPNIVFKIDNSITIKDKTLLPLIPPSLKSTKTITIDYSILDSSDKDVPKLLLFSNGWVYVKVIKQKDNTQSILKIDEISQKYKEQILKTKLPSDLVIPKDLIIDEGFKNVVNDLPIQIKKQEAGDTKQGEIKGLNGILYLTSSDTGKILYLDLKSISMIQSVQVQGSPLDIDYDKTNKLFYIVDFAKDKLYTLKPNENTISSTFDLPSMSSPTDIELSEDGSLIYVLESLSNELAVYKTNDKTQLLMTKLPNPTSFAVIKEYGLVAVTSANTNKLIFLNLNDLSKAHEEIIEGNPEKVVFDKINKLLYITSRNSNTISIFDLATKTMKNTIPVGETPIAIALHPSSKTIYVSNGKSNNISVIDLTTFQVIDTITLPIESQFPGDIKITPDGKFLIATSETTNTIPIIDLTSKQVIGKLDIGATTHKMYLVPSL